MQLCNAFALNTPTPGLAAGRDSHTGVPVAELQPGSEPGCRRSPEEPGVQAPAQQAAGSGVWRHWEGPAAAEGGRLHRDTKTNYR